LPLSSQQIITRFNRAASTYDEASALQREMADALLSRLESHAFENTIRIADLGCGTGYLLEQLQRLGFNDLHGFDIADEMLALVGSCTNIPSSRLTQADLQALPVADQQFDVVFSNAAIQWCDSARAANEIQRILRSGGRGFISTFGPQTLKQWRSVFESHGHASVHRFEPLAQLTAQFQEAGLKVNQIETRLVNQSFDNVKDMFGSIKKLGASNAADSRKPISKSAYRSIQSAFQQQLAREGILNLTFETISFEAVRL